MEELEGTDYLIEPMLRFSTKTSPAIILLPLETVRELTFFLSDQDFSKPLTLMFSTLSGDTTGVAELLPEEIEPLRDWLRSYLLRMSEGYGE